MKNSSQEKTEDVRNDGKISEIAESAKISQRFDKKV